ncbi:MAG: mononuclear molybdenum enzyme YedY, partial [Dehalococcoidia bacterium]|nr:mononuclear molybdenum enzyme YedY [Dehalococcoidia bacterium]
MYKFKSSEITPEHIYFSRRRFVVGAGALTGSLLFLGGCKQSELTSPGESINFCETAVAQNAMDELGDALTPCGSVIGYNNFYEFT